MSGDTGGLVSGGNPFSGSDIGSLLIRAQDFFTGLDKFLIGAQGQVGAIDLIGQFLIASALFNAWSAGANGQVSHGGGPGIGKILSPLIIGGMMLSWSHTTAMVSESLALSGGALGYVPQQSTAYATRVMEAIMSAIGVLGMISILRGLLKWKKAGDGDQHSGDDPMWAGFWHIFGGGIAYNIGPFMKMLGF